MKFNIEGWVLISYSGQMRFSAVYDSEKNKTVIGPANRNTGLFFPTDFGTVTVNDYRDDDEVPDGTNKESYLLKKDLIGGLLTHYFTNIGGNEWIKKAIQQGRQFNLSEEDMEHNDFEKFSFFFYVDPIKD